LAHSVYVFDDGDDDDDDDDNNNNKKQVCPVNNTGKVNIFLDFSVR